MKQTVETVRLREVDPETGRPTWVFKEVVKTHLTDEDRLSLATDIICGRTTAEEVQRKYGIVSINSVYTWVGKFLSQTKELSLQEQTEEDMANKSKDDQIRELKAQLKQARKEAELEKLRAHAYDTMINLAEEKFNIPIRKKSGTKQ
jgi:transposase-like protein